MKRLTILFFTLVLVSGCASSEAVKKEASYHYQMGLSNLAENNVTGALVEFTAAEKLTPDNPQLLNYLGEAYYRKRHFAKAEQKYLKALALKPSYSEARNNLGVDYMEMKRWDDAILNLKMVTEDIFFADQSSAGINLGLAYLGKGDYAQALSVLRSVAGAYPKDPRAHLNLGKVYMEMGKTALAIDEFRGAIGIFKDYANAYYNLGLAYLKINDKEAAQSAFKQVLRITPDSELGQRAKEYLNGTM